MSGNYHDARHLRALIRNMFGDDQNPNEAGMNIRQQPQQQQIYTGYPPLGNAFSRTPSVMQQSPAAMGSMFGRTPSFMQQSPAAMGNMQYQPAASSLQGARRSIYDRTPSEIQQEDEAYSSGETDQTAPTTKAVTKSTSTGGIMDFIKKNPVPVAVGGGLLALGIYQMMKPKAKTSGLSGVRSTTKRKTPTKTTARKKTTLKTVKLF